MYGGLIELTNTLSKFEWYHPRPPMASLSSKLGVCNLAISLISGTGKATDFKFGGCIYRANRNNSKLKILENRKRGCIQGLPKFFGYPLLSRERVKLRTSNLAGTFTMPIRIKAHEKFWRKGSVGVSSDCPIFWVPPIISGTGKATDFKFCRNISIRTKAHEKCWE